MGGDGATGKGRGGNGNKQNKHGRWASWGPNSLCASCGQHSWATCTSCYWCGKAFAKQAGQGKAGNGNTYAGVVAGGQPDTGKGDTKAGGKPARQADAVPAQAEADPSAQQVLDIEQLQSQLVQLSKSLGSESAVVKELTATIEEAKQRRNELRTPAQKAQYTDRTIAKKRGQLEAAKASLVQAKASRDKALLDIETHEARCVELQADLTRLHTERAGMGFQNLSGQQVVDTTIKSLTSILPAPYAQQNQGALAQIGTLLQQLIDNAVPVQEVAPDFGGNAVDGDGPILPDHGNFGPAPAVVGANRAEPYGHQGAASAEADYKHDLWPQFLESIGHTGSWDDPDQQLHLDFGFYKIKCDMLWQGFVAQAGPNAIVDPRDPGCVARFVAYKEQQVGQLG